MADRGREQGVSETRTSAVESNEHLGDVPSSERSVSWSGLERAISLLSSGSMPSVAVGELLRQELRAVRLAVETQLRCRGPIEDRGGPGVSHAPGILGGENSGGEPAWGDLHDRVEHLTQERDAALARVRELSRDLAHMGWTRNATPPPHSAPPAGMASDARPSDPARPSTLNSVVPSRYTIPSLGPQAPNSAGAYSVGPGRIAEEEVFSSPGHPATSRR